MFEKENFFFISLFFTIIKHRQYSSSFSKNYDFYDQSFDARASLKGEEREKSEEPTQAERELLSSNENQTEINFNEMKLLFLTPGINSWASSYIGMSMSRR